MSKTHTFTAEILAAKVGKGGAYIEVPFDVEDAFGSKRPKIVATFDGETYRGTLVKYGTPRHILIVRKDIRTKIAKEPGDTIEVSIALDTRPRVVVVPDELKALLAQDEKAQTIFDKLSYTHRKEYVNWINEAKREATRERRLLKTIEMLKEGKTR